MLTHNSQSGQTLIIILVIMVVSLTVGLAVASRSITDIRLSTQGEQSQRAFSAAEAGIEDALRQDLSSVVAGGGSISGNIGGIPYSVKVSQASASDSFATDKSVVKDDVAQINTNNSPGSLLDGVSLDIYWVDSDSTTETTSPRASIEVSEIYNLAGTWSMVRYAYNPVPADVGSGQSGNGFSSGTGCSCTVSSSTKRYSYKATIQLKTGTEIVRIKPIYNNASVAVKVPTGNTLPSQSYTVESTSTIGGVTRKIQTNKSNQALPPIFDYVLFSGSGPISK